MWAKPIFKGIGLSASAKQIYDIGKDLAQGAKGLFADNELEEIMGKTRKRRARRSLKREIDRDLHEAGASRRFARKEMQASRRNFVRGLSRTGGEIGNYKPDGPEMKYVDKHITFTNIPDTGTITSTINVVPTGTTKKTRIGNKVVIRRIRLNLNVYLAPTLGGVGGAMPSTDDSLRIIIYIDKQCNGATATVAEILDSSTAGIKVVNQWYNKDNHDRFIILADKIVNLKPRPIVWQIDAGDPTNKDNRIHAGRTEKQLKWDLNVLVPIYFSADTGVLTGIRSNNIGLLACTSKGRISWNGATRVEFLDV